MEARAVVSVSGQVGRQDLERVQARQSRVLGKVDLTHAAAAEQAQDAVVREHRAFHQRHGTEL